MIHVHIAMKMVCQNLLRLDNLHYHVYTYMNLSSSIKLEPFYKLHLVLLEEHCATSCLVMADCGALLSHKKRHNSHVPCGGTLLQVEPPQNDLLDPCSETITLIFHDLLISLVVLGLLFPKIQWNLQKVVLVGFHLLPTSTFSHMPTVQPLNIFEPMNSPLVLQSPFKWTI